MHPGLDVFHYVVSCDDFCMLFVVLGVDTSTHCGPLSNVDFVHFVWDNFDRFNLKKYVMTLLPSETLSKLKLLCLKYYRGNSDGWKDLGNCDNCVEEYIDIICPLTHCRLPNVCSCTIFTRQPLSLLHSAAHVQIPFTCRTV